MRDWLSASVSRMLRDASIRIGTTASRTPEGGSSTIGRNRNSTSAASTSARRAASVPRWTLVSGDNGRRYSTKVAAPMAAIRRTASHHGRGCAKCICLRQGLGIRD
jgi:hypothetical protein